MCLSATAPVRVNRGSTWMIRRPAGLGLRHPLEAHRMALGHVGALDDDAVGIGHVLQGLRRAAAPERGSQTGNRGGVSNAGLVLDLDRACGGEELLDQVVLFVVQGRAAQRGDAHGAAEQRGPSSSMSCQVLRRDSSEPVGHHVDGGVQVEALPVAGARRTVEHLVWRPGALTSCSLAEPLGQSRPREIGESGSPSIWTTFSSLTYTRWPQPTAQYGHTLCTTRSAVDVRGVMRACAWRSPRARGPTGRQNVNCRTTGHSRKNLLFATTAD